MRPDQLILSLATLAASLVLSPASPARSATAASPSSYVTDAQFEVMTQNLICDDLRAFLNKRLSDTLLQVAEDILNQPAHQKETSDTLFGQTFTRMILTASRAESCTVILPLGVTGEETGGVPDPHACSGTGTRKTAIRDVSMAGGVVSSAAKPGEIKVLSAIDTAARLRNCRI